jgi:hypothetical protein
MTKWEEAALDLLDFREICPGRFWTAQQYLRPSSPRALPARRVCSQDRWKTAAGDSRALLTRIRSVPTRQSLRTCPLARALTANEALVFCPIYKKAEFLKVYGPIRLASRFHATPNGRNRS